MSRPILKAVRAIEGWGHPFHSHSGLYEKSGVAFLEITNRTLLKRILPLLVLLDVVQEVLLVGAVTIAGHLGINVLIEDFTPTVSLEHIVYLNIYGKREAISGLLAFGSYHLVSSLTKTWLRDQVMCLYLAASPQVREGRSNKRGHRFTDTATLHDLARQGLLVKFVKRGYVNQTVIETDKKGIHEVFLDVKERISTVPV